MGHHCRVPVCLCKCSGSSSFCIYQVSSLIHKYILTRFGGFSCSNSLVFNFEPLTLMGKSTQRPGINLYICDFKPWRCLSVAAEEKEDEEEMATNCYSMLWLWPRPSFCASGSMSWNCLYDQRVRSLTSTTFPTPRLEFFAFHLFFIPSSGTTFLVFPFPNSFFLLSFAYFFYDFLLAFSLRRSATSGPWPVFFKVVFRTDGFQLKILRFLFFSILSLETI